MGKKNSNNKDLWWKLILGILFWPIGLLYLLYKFTKKQLAENPESVWYKQTWGIILVLIFFYPVGVYLLWKYGKFQKTGKQIATACFGVLFLISLINASRTAKYEQEIQSTQSTAEIITETEEPNRSLLIDEEETESESETEETTTEEITTEMETEELTTEEITTEPETEEPTTEEVTTEPETEEPTILVTQSPATQVPEPQMLHFIANEETKCAHINPNCSAAEQILPENCITIDIREDQLSQLASQYWACGKCSKRYADELPKF